MKPVKRFEEYIIENKHHPITLNDYLINPATAFLKYLVHAKDATKQCQTKFKVSRAKKYTDDALDSIYIINAGLLASIMGNFETYQKYLFANMFEYSIYLKEFNLSSFLKNLKNTLKISNSTTSNKFEVDFIRFAAYRDTSIPVGLVLADQLSNWQSPTMVNEYFMAFSLKDHDGNKKNIYSKDDIENLSILWQMRHSIVHTASTITLPDAQKIRSLSEFGGKVISLDLQFILEVARKMHPIIKRATENMRNNFVNNLKNDVSTDTKKKIDDIFSVKSSCSSWLR